MSQVIITIGVADDELESEPKEFVVHTSPNAVYGEDYEYFRNTMDARAAAEDGKGELEAAGYTVKVIWNRAARHERRI